MTNKGRDVAQVATAVIVGAAWGALVAAPAIWIAIMSGGAGHGDYVAARALFPAPMLLTLIEGEIGSLAMAAALVQFPLYGALLGRARARGRDNAMIWIAGVHLGAVLLCFAGLFPSFS